MTEHKIGLNAADVKRLLSCAAAALICALFILIFCQDRAEAMRLFFAAVFSSPADFAGLLNASAAAVLAALAFSLCFQCRQYSMAPAASFCLAQTAVAAFLLNGGNTNSALLIVFALLISMAVGAGASFIPAWLNRHFRSGITLISLMSDYVILQFCGYILIKFMRNPAVSGNAAFTVQDRLLLPAFTGSGIRIGVLIAAALATLFHLLLYRTKVGYGIRAVGASSTMAGYIGLNSGAIILATQVTAGAAAGLGGALDVMAAEPQLVWTGSVSSLILIGLVSSVLFDAHPARSSVGAVFFCWLLAGGKILGARGVLQSDFSFFACCAAAVLCLCLKRVPLRPVRAKTVQAAAPGRAADTAETAAVPEAPAAEASERPQNESADPESDRVGKENAQ